MKKLNVLAIMLVFFFLASGVQAQSSDDALDLEELSFLEELAFEPFCPNQTATATVCVGNKLCFNGGSDWKYPTYDDAGNPKCERGYTVTTVNSVAKACEAAEDVAGQPANCPNLQQDVNYCDPYCHPGSVTPTPNSTATCCTVTNTRTCMLVRPTKEEGEVLPH